MSDRPFKVLGIQQIAVSGLDKSRLRKLWVDTLGLELSGTFRERVGKCRRRHCQFLAPAL